MKVVLGLFILVSLVFCQNGNETPDGQFTQTLPFPFEDIDFQFTSNGTRLTLNDAEGPREHILTWNTDNTDKIGTTIKGEILRNGNLGVFGFFFRYGQPANNQGKDDTIGFVIDSDSSQIKTIKVVDSVLHESQFAPLLGVGESTWIDFTIINDQANSRYSLQFNGPLTSTYYVYITDSGEFPANSAFAFYNLPSSTGTGISLRNLNRVFSDGSVQIAAYGACVDDNQWNEIYNEAKNTVNACAPFRQVGENGKCASNDPCLAVSGDCSVSGTYCCSGTSCISGVCSTC